MTAPCPCATSGVPLHGHHHDYAKPLEIEWLCVACHVAEHRGFTPQPRFFPLHLTKED